MAHRHTLRGNACTEAASLWIFVDTESLPVPLAGDPTKLQHRLRLGSALFRRLSGADVIQEQWLDFTQPDQFWTWLESHLSDHRPLWLVTHNTAFDWPLLDGYSYLSRHGLEKWRLIFGPPVTLFSGRPNGKSLVVVDSLNYFRGTLEEISHWIGLPKLPLPPWTAADDVWQTYCHRDVEIVAEAMRRLVALHRTEDLGVLGKTLAQCALHSYRHRFAPKVRCRVDLDSRAAARGQTHEDVTRIAFHGDEELSVLERAGYYGGRVECRRIGEAQGPIYQLDANSLYASIMRSERLPCRLVEVVRDAPLDWLAERLGLYECVASVYLQTDRATYPYRVTHALTTAEQSRLEPGVYERLRRRSTPIYPRGRYPTVLCGAELRRALARGHVQEVYACAVYERAVLFEQYVDYWYGVRLDAFRSGDRYLERLAKSYLTALAGVWAKRAPRWVAATDWIPTEPWERWVCNDAITGAVREYRSIAHVPQEAVEDGEPADVLPIVSACITSAGRELLRDWQAVAGHEHWLYEDTDALLVDQTGYERLLAAGQIDETRLGALRVQSVSDRVTIHGVKDYELDGRRVVKGVRADAEWLDESTVRQWHWAGHRAQHRTRAEIGPLQELRTLYLDRIYTKGRVDSAGWTHPFELEQDRRPFDLF